MSGVFRRGSFIKPELLEARVAHPFLTWAELARFCGCSKEYARAVCTSEGLHACYGRFTTREELS